MNHSPVTPETGFFSPRRSYMFPTSAEAKAWPVAGCRGRMAAICAANSADGGTGFCILMTVVTLGIYSLVWYYQVHDEMKRHTSEGLGGGLALVLAILVGFVSPPRAAAPEAGRASLLQEMLAQSRFEAGRQGHLLGPIGRVARAHDIPLSCPRVMFADLKDGSTPGNRGSLCGQSADYTRSQSGICPGQADRGGRAGL